MTNSFHRLSRSLRSDNGMKSATGLVVALGLLACWLVWVFETHVTRYEISDSARLEVTGAAYPLQANATGRLIVSKLVLGREVRAGDVLAELDSDGERLSLQEEQTRLAALAPQLQVLRSQLTSEQEGKDDERRVLQVSTAAASAQYQDAAAQAVLADQDAKRASRLRAEGIMSHSDAEHVKAEAQSKRAAAETLKGAISKLEPELEVRDRNRQIRLEQILEEIAKCKADMEASSATSKRLKYAIERRRIRAPIAGHLGECAALRPGSHISEGQQLGVIIPSGNLEVVAEFQPSAAFGKVRVGQHAVLRLQGFPWAQYGTVSARVTEVADELRDGKVRVELALNLAPRSRILFQHGLPGSVEIEVDRLSPAALILQSAGDILGPH